MTTLYYFFILFSILGLYVQTFCQKDKLEPPMYSSIFQELVQQFHKLLLDEATLLACSYN